MASWAGPHTPNRRRRKVARAATLPLPERETLLHDTGRMRPIGFGSYRAAVLTDPDYFTGRDDR